MSSSDETAKKFRALKEAIDEAMADVEAGRVVPWDLEVPWDLGVPWDLEDFPKRAHEQIK